MEIVFLSLKIVLALIVILLLMLATAKLSSSKFNKVSSKKSIKVLEKIQLSKDTSIFVLKVLNKGYIVSISPNNTTLIDELTEEEVALIENNKKEEVEKITETYSAIINNGTNMFKNIRKRNNKDEK